MQGTDPPCGLSEDMGQSYLIHLSTQFRLATIFVATVSMQGGILCIVIMHVPKRSL